MMNIHERDDKFSALWGVDPQLGLNLVTLGLDFKSHFQHSLTSKRTDIQEYLQVPAWTLSELAEASRGIKDIEIDWSVVMASDRPVDSLAAIMQDRLIVLAKDSEDSSEASPDTEESVKEKDTIPS